MRDVSGSARGGQGSGRFGEVVASGFSRTVSHALATVAVAAFLAQPATALASEKYVLIVSGASGGQEYAAQYARWTRDLTAVMSERMKIDREHMQVLTDTPDPAASS